MGSVWFAAFKTPKRLRRSQSLVDSHSDRCSFLLIHWAKGRVEQKKGKEKENRGRNRAAELNLSPRKPAWQEFNTHTDWSPAASWRGMFYKRIWLAGTCTYSGLLCPCTHLHLTGQHGICSYKRTHIAQQKACVVQKKHVTCDIAVSHL